MPTRILLKKKISTRKIRGGMNPLRRNENGETNGEHSNVEHSNVAGKSSANPIVHSPVEARTMSDVINPNGTRLSNFVALDKYFQGKGGTLFNDFSEYENCLNCYNALNNFINLDE